MFYHKGQLAEHSIIQIGIAWTVLFIYLFVISRALQGHSADVRYNYVTKYLQ